MSDRIGVIGAGIMGADHVNTLHRFVRGATVAAVADVALDRAEAAAEAGARPYDDAFALITDPGVDAVVIASHDSVHAEQVVEAVKAGKPVLSEKPLAPSLADARQVLRTIGTGGEVLLSLAFMRRFDPGYVELRAAIESGRIGAPVLMHNVSRGVASGPGSTSESSITGSAVHGVRCGGMASAFAGRGFLVVVDAERTRSIGFAADWQPRFADAYRLELQAWLDAVSAGRPTPLATARDGAVADAVITSMRQGGRVVTVEAL